MRQLFYYKMRQKFIAKCVRFFITKCDSFISKCGSYYKLRRFLQIDTVHSHYSYLTQSINDNFFVAEILEKQMENLKKEIIRSYNPELQLH